MALAAAKGDKTLSELASQFGDYPNQISAWKKQLVDQLLELFEEGRKRHEPDADVERSQLYEEIGRLKVELDWLKKRLPSGTADKRSLFPADPQNDCD